MNGFCRALQCFYGAQFDPGNDEWVAIKVYRDGVPIRLASFKTEDEAEDCAGLEHLNDLEANGQLGVGA